MNRAVIKRRILHCIDLIYENDSDLFERGNYEVTISTKLAQYLFIEFKDYDVDCEYDRHIDDEKRVAGRESDIRPDIVIHRRGTDEQNLACIEIKKEQNTQSRNADFEKLRALTREYGYQLGMFIEFGRNRGEVDRKYFENGEEVGEWEINGVG